MNMIKSLTDEQLTAELSKHGEPVSAITDSTRAIFERRLLNYLTPREPAPLAESEDIVLTSDQSVPERPSENRAAAQIVSTGSHILEDKQTTKTKEPALFYGVQLPPGSIIEEDVVFVFIDQTEALKLMKKFPGSRFKPFSTRQDAVRFSRGLPDLVPASPRQNILHPNPLGPPPSPSKPFPIDVSNYRSVRTQDLVKLRKLLEIGDILGAKCLIWSNPRYLINSGDTPTILQEGFRYNALHVAAMKNQAQSAQLILDTLENPEFMQLLYVGEPEQSRYNRIKFLVDLYLNTPDKGLGETALHFACKFGHADVVSVLAAHPKTDRFGINKYGDTPADLICSRSKVVAGPELRKKIGELIEDQYYVQLYRAEDNSCPPHVPDPWSPTVEADDTLLHCFIGEGSPPTHNDSITSARPRDSPVSVKAYAGPMTFKQAKRFRKHWLTPSSISPEERKQIADIRRRDTDKGLERIGRGVAHTMDIPWSEYWNFLGAYVDFSSEEGLKKLEHYMKERYNNMRRKCELDLELSLVSARLNQLELNSPTSPRNNIFGGKSLGNCFGDGDTLVLYMEKNMVPSDSGDINHGDGNTTTDKLTHDNKDSLSDNQYLTENHTEPLPSGLVDSARMGVGAEPVFNMSREYENIPLIDDSDSESSVDSFYTATDMDDSDTESLYTPPESVTPRQRQTEEEFFIYGAEPSKMDIDVQRALDGVTVSEKLCPYIWKWKKQISLYLREETARWGTPRHIRLDAQSRINAITPSHPILPAGSTPYSPITTHLSPQIYYRSPSFSPSSASSESDTSFDNGSNARLNLLSTFMLEK